jgi:putative hemolysin
MQRRGLWASLVLASTLFLTACTLPLITPTPQANLPNPASVYCEQHGGRVEFRQDASGGVAGVCVFPDGSECDEWAYFRGECAPATGASIVATTTVEALQFPTPLPIDPAEWEGWWSYKDEEYGFSLRLPPDWVVDETTTGDPLMDGHLLNLHPKESAAKLNIRMSFRRVGEDVLLWPTGVGEGEFIFHGTLDVAGEAAQRVLFVCPGGQVGAIWYHQSANEPNLLRGNLELGFIFGYTGMTCATDHNLSGKEQHVGEMIIASLTVP